MQAKRKGIIRDGQEITSCNIVYVGDFLARLDDTDPSINYRYKIIWEDENDPNHKNIAYFRDRFSLLSVFGKWMISNNEEAISMQIADEDVIEFTFFIEEDKRKAERIIKLTPGYKHKDILELITSEESLFGFDVNYNFLDCILESPEIDKVASILDKNGISYEFKYKEE